MARISIRDLPKGKRISKAELKAITGGGLASSPLGFTGASREPLFSFAIDPNPLLNMAESPDPGGHPPGPNLEYRARPRIASALEE